MLSRAEFYPQDVPVFALISLYDVFLLGASLEGLVTLASEEVRQDEECDNVRDMITWLTCPTISHCACQSLTVWMHTPKTKISIKSQLSVLPVPF